MAGMSQALVSKLLNATTPTGTSGVPGTFAAYGGTAMKLKLTSTSSTAAASGTELTGTGYTAGGQAFANAITASTAGSSVTMPITTALSWTNTSGGSWTIYSFELTDSAAVRTWFGDFNGAPITVANNNTFQIAVAGITIGLA
jgi:hypothetical protein